MRYITDIHALNLSNDLDTTGDWHRGAIQWEAPRMGNTDTSPFGSWGIMFSSPVTVPEHEGETFNIANHLRACADAIAAGRFTIVQGMKETFIGNDKYNLELFEQIIKLQTQDNWPDINNFMTKEYGLEWVNFCEENSASGAAPAGTGVKN